MADNYTISDAAKVFDLTSADLRNYISRGYLRSCGTPSGPGKERTFDRLCLYELGLLRELSERNIPLAFGARIVSREIELARIASAFALTSKDVQFSETMNSIEGKGYDGMPSSWTHRDLEAPTLWVFIADKDEFGLESCVGWKGVGSAAQRLVRGTYATLMKSVPRGGPAAKNPDPPKDYLDFGRTFFYVFNLTAALVKVDHLVNERLARQ